MLLTKINFTEINEWKKKNYGKLNGDISQAKMDGELRGWGSLGKLGLWTNLNLDVLSYRLYVYIFELAIHRTMLDVLFSTREGNGVTKRGSASEKDLNGRDVRARLANREFAFSWRHHLPWHDVHSRGLNGVFKPRKDSWAIFWPN